MHTFKFPLHFLGTTFPSPCQLFDLEWKSHSDLLTIYNPVFCHLDNWQALHTYLFSAKWKTGWCKNSAGIKQESGTVDLGASIRWHEEGWKKVTAELCLKYCKLTLGATGCEFLPGKTCLAHTKDVVSASGPLQDYEGQCYILPIGWTFWISFRQSQQS